MDSVVWGELHVGMGVHMLTCIGVAVRGGRAPPSSVGTALQECSTGDAMLKTQLSSMVFVHVCVHVHTLSPCSQRVAVPGSSTDCPAPLQPLAAYAK